MKILRIVLSLIIITSIFNVSFANIDNTNKYAWGEDTGWINFNPTGGNVVVSSSQISGNIWSDNYGWINLQPTNGGVNNTCNGILSGYAWGENTGWINFADGSIDVNGDFQGVIESDQLNSIALSGTNFGVSTSWSHDCVTPPPVAPPTSGGFSNDAGGGSQKVHIIRACLASKCVNRYPVLSSTSPNDDKTYAEYEKCRNSRTLAKTGKMCSENWAISNNLQLCSDDIDCLGENKYSIVNNENNLSLDRLWNWNRDRVSAEDLLKNEDSNALTRCVPIQLKRIRENIGKGIKTDSFKDLLPNNKQSGDVIYLAEQGIIEGKGSKKEAKLDDKLLRVEAAKIVSIAKEHELLEGLNCYSSDVFSDVDDGQWYYSYVYSLKNKGIINGYEDKTYKPSDFINLGEIYRILATTFDYITTEEAQNLLKEGEEWYIPYKNVLENNELIPDYFANYSYSEEISRGDFFSVLSTILREKDSE